MKSFCRTSGSTTSVTVIGIAARNGIMMVSHFRHLEHVEGVPFGRDLVMRGAEERLAPILMTALATGLALLPIAFGGDKAGQEIEHPLAFFAGLTAILAKLGVAGMRSNLATLIRVRREWVWPGSVALKPLGFLVLSGIATGLSWMCYFRALQLAPASMVAPIDKLSVVFAIVLGIVVLGEPLSWRLVLGGGLIVAGALVVATA